MRATRAPATCNRYLALLQRVYSYANEVGTAPLWAGFLTRPRILSVVGGFPDPPTDSTSVVGGFPDPPTDSTGGLKAKRDLVILGPCPP